MTDTTFNTTGVPYPVLQFMAQKTQESVMNGGTAVVTGNQSAMLASLAGVTLDANGNATMKSPTLAQNLASADPTGIVKAAEDTYNNSGPPKGKTISQWLMQGAGNYSLIAFGAVIAIAALIYSQRENVTAVVKQASKVAALAA